LAGWPPQLPVLWAFTGGARMARTRLRSRPITLPVEHPDRIGPVTATGLDETLFTRKAPFASPPICSAPLRTSSLTFYAAPLASSPMVFAAPFVSSAVWHRFAPAASGDTGRVGSGQACRK
jgi:hypothetical protein